MISDAIKKGWNKSIRFQMFSTEQQWKRIKPEYLTTVHIAQNIVDKNTDFGWPFVVKISDFRLGICITV